MNFRMNFDPQKFMRQITNAAQDMVVERLSKGLETLRCEQHPDSRVTVKQAPSGDSRIQISDCCEAFKEKANAALGEMGAIPKDSFESLNVEQPNSDQQPLAFISHSSADKDRIARPLDHLLRERGIRVWLDERDLLPGRNLVDEIFSQGISKSDAFVAILTSNSIDSKWVHEELTNAFVRKIEGVVKIIIPVIMDGITPPDFLKHTVWERINDENLQLHADRIAAAIIGLQPAPIAAKPAYAGIPVYRLAGLSADDERLFAAACRRILDESLYYPVVDFPQLFEYGKSVGMSEEQVEESLAALEHRGYFTNVIHSLGQRYAAGGRISQWGLGEYLCHYMPEEYRKAKLDVISDIVNGNGHSSQMMAHSLKIHEPIVEHILTDLEHGNHVIASHHNEGMSVRANPTLRRVLRELENE